MYDIYRKPELLKGVYAMGFNKPSKIQVNYQIISRMALYSIPTVPFLCVITSFHEINFHKESQKVEHAVK